MTAEIVLSGFPVMSMFGNRKLTDKAFVAASDDARDEYESLAQRQIQLKKKLRQLEYQGKQNSPEYNDAQADLRQIESQL